MQKYLGFHVAKRADGKSGITGKGNLIISVPGRFHFGGPFYNNLEKTAYLEFKQAQKDLFENGTAEKLTIWIKKYRGIIPDV